jgi:hypothetical protein
MQLTIVKLRLLGVLSLAGCIAASIFKVKAVAEILIIISLLSFLVIIFLYVKESAKNGAIKRYFSAKEKEEE